MKRLGSGRSLATAILLWMFAAGAAQAAQGYQTDVTSFWVSDSSGTPMAAIVYYPWKQHNGQPIPEGTQFPATVFMQGGNTDAYRYTWLRELAAYGYIVVLPDKYPVVAAKLNGENGLNTNTKLTTVDLLDASVKRLHEWAAEPESEIAGRFDGQVSIAGHSLGAVIGIVALDPQRCIEDPASAAIAMCPPGYSLHPSIGSMWMIGGSHEAPNGPPDPSELRKPNGFPVYMINGTRDGLNTTAEGHTSFKRFRAPKIFFDIEGANHFGWGDYLHPEDNLRAEVPATIHPQEQQAISLNAIRLFLDCNHKGDLAACGTIPSTPVP